MQSFVHMVCNFISFLGQFSPLHFDVIFMQHEMRTRQQTAWRVIWGEFGLKLGWTYCWDEDCIGTGWWKNYYLCKQINILFALWFYLFHFHPKCFHWQNSEIQPIPPLIHHSASTAQQNISFKPIYNGYCIHHAEHACEAINRFGHVSIRCSPCDSWWICSSIWQICSFSQAPFDKAK